MTILKSLLMFLVLRKSDDLCVKVMCAVAMFCSVFIDGFVSQKHGIHIPISLQQNKKWE